MGCAGSSAARRGGTQPPELVLSRPRTEMSYKVVLLGDKAVGKSSLVLRYTRGQFQERHALTIGGAFVAKKVVLRSSAHDNGDTPMLLHIWDTAGEEAYRSMTRFFYRDAKIAIVVYDITQPESFENLQARAGLA